MTEGSPSLPSGAPRGTAPSGCRAVGAKGLVVGALLLCAAGCAHAPEATLDRYLSLLASHDEERASELLSSSYRSHKEPKALVAELKSGPPPLPRTPRGSSRVEYRAQGSLKESVVPLVFDGMRWRLDRDPLDSYPQGTPDETLRSFLRALELRRYDMAVRLIPGRYRRFIDPEVLRSRWEGPAGAEWNEQLAEARRHLGEPFELSPSGDEARLPLGEGRYVRLIREDGTWRVMELQ